MPGVIRTRVGYTGGSKSSPTYHRLGNHTEALQVDFDPAVLSYRDLLDEIFNRHDPFNNIGHTQYQNAIWYQGDRQHDVLSNYLRDHYDVPPTSSRLATVIEPIGTFHRAEDYHQKYHLRKHDSYMDLFEDYSLPTFTDSTLAARLNGILAGQSTGLEKFSLLENSDIPDRLKRDLKSRIS